MARMTKEEQDKKKEHAKLLFTKENISSQKDLAERVGVTEKTIARWIKFEGWEKLKRNFILTREEQLANLLEELSELNEAIKNQPEGFRFAGREMAQVRRQLVKDIKDLETKALLPEIINAMTQFLDYIRKQDLDVAKEISIHVDSFIKSKL